MGKDYYKALKKAGVKMQCHESDLWAEATPEALDITKDAPNRSFFRDNIDGKRWMDLPFQCTPFWKNKERRKK